MRLLMVAVVTVLWASGVAARTEDVRELCKMIEEDVRDCGCAIEIMGQHLTPQQTKIMFSLWAAGRGYLGKGAFESMHKEYGSTTLSEAVWSFGTVKDNFFSRCNPAGMIPVMQDYW